MDRLERRRLLTTIYVDASAGGSADGSSWTHAYTDLQQALAGAGAGDRINVAQGTYKPTAGADVLISFQLKSGVGLYGGYAGGGSATPDDRNVGAYPTILSGDIGEVGSINDNSYHVVNGSGVDATAIFDGFTVTAGNAPGNPQGGAPGTTPANTPGGAMYNRLGAPTVRNSTFVGNVRTAVWNDGRLNGQNYGASPTFTDCVFASNTNLGTAQGGGLYNYFSHAVVTRCSFVNNSANSGAAVVNWSSRPVFRDSVFKGNTASFGGAIESGFSTVQFTNCAFVGNSTIGGGAVASDVNFTSTTYTNCTFTANSGPSTLINWAGNGVSGTMTNSIVWNNAVTSVVPGGAVVTYSDIQGGFAGTGNINADPVFVQSPGPGADGTWGTADDTGDLRLSATSPAIDAGNNAAVPGAVTLDLAGKARIVDYPGAKDGAGAVVDMGAYEARLNVLHIAENELYAFSAPGVYPVDQLIIDSGGQLDLGTSTVILPRDAMSDVATWIASGSQAGRWTGPGIASSAAASHPDFLTGIGYFDDGQEITITATPYGDANLDGRVDADDAALIVLGRATGGTRWSDGNFNYNTGLDADDFILFLRGAAHQTAPAAPAAAASLQSRQELEILLSPMAAGVL